MRDIISLRSLTETLLHPYHHINIKLAGLNILGARITKYEYIHTDETLITLEGYV